MSSVSNKVILVTGATSGIGRSLTAKLLAEGAHVAFCGRSKTKMDQLLNELDPYKSHFFHDTFDISDEARIIKFVNDASNRLGKIDILVNCAGANSARDQVCNIKTSDLESMIKVNLVAPFIFMKEVYNSCMSDRKEGLIINVLSTVCNYSNEGIGAYTASKAGFDALVKVFRKEARDNNVKVCSIYPGGVNTAFRSEDKPEYLNPETVVDAIISMMEFGGNAIVDELVIRPMIEKNF